VDDNSAASSNPGRTGSHGPTLAENLASVDNDVSSEVPSAMATDGRDATDELSAAAGEDTPDGGQSSGQDQMPVSEVRRRAVTGVVVDTMRGIGLRVVALLGTLVTARLLTPYDFGLVAIGTTVLTFGSFLDDGGIGNALIRRPEAPTKSELQSLVAFQFGLEVLLVLAIALVMLPFGFLGQVTTVIVMSLPLGAFRSPSYILYERQLNYRPMAVVEVVETSAYYVWAITTIAIGWGVWGLATAFVVKAVTGLTLLLVLLPEGRVRPVLSWSKVRPLLGFGIRYQAVGFVQMLRDQGVNIAVATFGGVAVLGLWNVAWRIIQIPVSLLQALWRVSFPGMSRLVSAKEDVGGTIERVIALVAIGTGALVAPLAASSAAWIHVLIGPQWEKAATAIPPACLAMTFGVPISVALTGYLWAIGAASTPLRSALIVIPAMQLVLLPLLPILGVTAVGIAYVVAVIVDASVLVVGARRTATFRIGTRLAIPTVVATVAAAVGWLVARWVGPDLAGALSSSAVAFGVFIGGLAAFHRADLADAWALVGRGLRGVVARSTDTRPRPQPTPAAG
jgi:O-antigen/teichoic acid export membrane protein